jgi:hypothetical protein
MIFDEDLLPRQRSPPRQNRENVLNLVPQETPPVPFSEQYISAYSPIVEARTRAAATMGFSKLNRTVFILSLFFSCAFQEFLVSLSILSHLRDRWTVPCLPVSFYLSLFCFLYIFFLSPEGKEFHYQDAVPRKPDIPLRSEACCAPFPLSHLDVFLHFQEPIHGLRSGTDFIKTNALTVIASRFPRFPILPFVGALSTPLPPFASRQKAIT